MRCAVSVPKLGNNLELNYATILSHIDDAVENRVELLMFPEATLTGLVISDDYSVDKQYAMEMSSEYILCIKEKAALGNIWIALGFLEKEGDTMFDSAILINSIGEIALHYRRISPGWRAPNADPREYGVGKEYATTLTPWGRVGFLICGDLFDVPHLATDAQLDILLFPFARCFEPGITDEQQEWDTLEWPEYAAQIRKVGAITLMANYIAPPSLEGGAFGGGFITDAEGTILASLPLYQEGLLISTIGV